MSTPLTRYLAHRAEYDEAVARVLAGGQYILGAEVETFERAFASYLGTSHAIGVGNGTDAVHLALRACGVAPGDEVITVSHTAVATVAAIELAGATPVLVDVDGKSYTLDPQRVEETLRARPRARAIVCVHLYGQPADVVALGELADRHGVALVEDCAQSHGARVGERATGTFGRVAAFSFYPTKNLGALGDGGAVVTGDARIAERVRLLREYGWRERFISECAGMNSRLDPIQAAILSVGLRHLDRENDARRSVARKYDEWMDAIGIAPPRARPGSTHVYHQYVVEHDRRDELRAHLARAGVATAIHYPAAVHQQPAYAGRVPVGAGGLGVTERLIPRILSLPMHPYLEPSLVERVGAALKEWA